MTDPHTDPTGTVPPTGPTGPTDPVDAADDARWHLVLHSEPLRIARLPPGSAVPEWSRRPSPLSSVTWNAHETSVIAAARYVPVGADQAGPFRAFEIQGPLDFTLVGVLRGLLTPLADHDVSVITKSTFDTDWILVPVEQVAVAVAAWRARGHVVETPDEDATGATGAAGAPGAPATPDTPGQERS